MLKTALMAAGLAVVPAGQHFAKAYPVCYDNNDTGNVCTSGYPGFWCSDSFDNAYGTPGGTTEPNQVGLTCGNI